MHLSFCRFACEGSIKLPEQVRETIRRFGMIRPGQAITVACSGGPDSVALLLILSELSSELGFSLSVCHLNHCLRGKESEADELFVKELAAKLRLAAYVEAAQVRELAHQSGMNLEQMARELRYRFFRSLLAAGRADRVAVGHTMDDQAETVIHRLLRGTGIAGLAGIYPVIGNYIIRPLIETRRAELRQWLLERQQEWRQDSSNCDLHLMRNRIRSEVLPLLSSLNPRAVKRVCDTAEIAREEEAFWKEYVPGQFEKCVEVESGSARVDIRRLRELPLAVARRVLRLAFHEVAAALHSGQRQAPRPSDTLDFDHLRQILELAYAEQGAGSVSLPGGLEAKREFGHLILRPGITTLSGFKGFSYCLRVPGRIDVPEIGSSFSAELIKPNESDARYNEGEKALLDRKLVEIPLTIRNWQPGDQYKPNGHRTRKKLKELFQKKRISVGQRHRWPVLVAGDEIVWTRIWGPSADFAPAWMAPEAILFEESIR